MGQNQKVFLLYLAEEIEPFFERWYKQNEKTDNGQYTGVGPFAYLF